MKLCLFSWTYLASLACVWFVCMKQVFSVWLLRQRFSWLFVAIIAVLTRICPTQSICDTCPWTCLLSLDLKKIDRRRGLNKPTLIDILHLFDFKDLLWVVYAFVDHVDLQVLRVIRFRDLGLAVRRILRAYNFLNVLRVQFCLLQVELLEILVKLINVGHWLIIHSFAVVLAQLHGEVFLFRRMEERTNFRLVAAKLVAGDAFVFVRVVKPFHSGVAFVAF